MRGRTSSPAIWAVPRRTPGRWPSPCEELDDSAGAHGRHDGPVRDDTSPVRLGSPARKEGSAIAFVPFEHDWTGENLKCRRRVPAREKVVPVLARLRRILASRPARTARREPSRQHNLFEAAATYVTASIEDDDDRLDEASGWVAPDALVFGVNQLACRAVIALARERNVPVEAVARDLLGLPGAERAGSN